MRARRTPLPHRIGPPAAPPAFERFPEIVFGRRRSLDGLRAELEEVEALISAHPLASPRIRAAHVIVGNKESRDAADIDRQLADDGLPCVEELGRAQVAGFWSWWKLHRRKRKLRRRIERAGDR